MSTTLLLLKFDLTGCSYCPGTDDTYPETGGYSINTKVNIYEPLHEPQMSHLSMKMPHPTMTNMVYDNV